MICLLQLQLILSYQIMTTTTPNHHNHLTLFSLDQTNMIGFHNVLLIAPPPSSSSSVHQHQVTNIYDQVNILNKQDSWTTLKRYPQEESGSAEKDALIVFYQEGNYENENGIGSSRVCRDCGNRAKKECQFRRCRTCCKSRGYDCGTHVKSTWVPAARRRKRHGCDGGGSSGSSFGGVVAKRPRDNSTNASYSFSTTSNNGGAPFSFDTGSNCQDASFKQSLPSQVRARAVFRCIRVTAINGVAEEVGYQATVIIRGHVFKGYLYDQGIVDAASASQRMLRDTT